MIRYDYNCECECDTDVLVKVAEFKQNLPPVTYINNITIVSIVNSTNSSLNISDTSVILGGTTILTNLNVYNDSILLGNLTVGSDLNVEGDIIGKNATILSNLNVSGNVILNSNLSLLSNLFVGGDTIINNSLNVSGVSILNDISIRSQLNVSGLSNLNNASISSNLNVSGLTNLNNIIVSSNLNVSGLSLFINNSTFCSNLNISGNSFIGNNLNIAGDLNISKTSTFNNTSIFNSDVNVKGFLNISGPTTINYNPIIPNLPALSINGYSLLGSTTIQSNLFVSNNTVLNRNVSIGSNIVNTDLNVYSNTKFYKPLDISASYVNISAPTTIYSKLVVNNDIIISGNLNVSGNININQNIGLDTIELNNISTNYKFSATFPNVLSVTDYFEKVLFNKDLTNNIAYAVNAVTSLAVINVNNNTVIDNIFFNKSINDITFHPNQPTAYAIHNTSISIINTKTNLITSELNIPSITTPFKKFVICPNLTRDVGYLIQNSINIIPLKMSNYDIQTNILGLTEKPINVTFSNDGYTAYALSDNYIFIIDVAAGQSNSNIQLSANTYPATIKYCPDLTKNLLYVLQQNVSPANGNILKIDILNTTSNSIIVEQFPTDFVFTNDGKYAWVVNSGSSSVSIINVDTNAITKMSISSDPRYIDISSNDSKLYISHNSSNIMSVIDRNINVSSFLNCNNDLYVKYIDVNNGIRNIGTLNVSGISDLQNVKINDGLFVSGTTNINNNLSVSGASTMFSNFNVSGNTYLNNTFILSNLNISGTANMSKLLVNSSDVYPLAIAEFNTTNKAILLPRVIDPLNTIPISNITNPSLVGTPGMFCYNVTDNIPMVFGISGWAPLGGGGGGDIIYSDATLISSLFVSGITTLQNAVSMNSNLSVSGYATISNISAPSLSINTTSLSITGLINTPLYVSGNSLFYNQLESNNLNTLYIQSSGANYNTNITSSSFINITPNNKIYVSNANTNNITVINPLNNTFIKNITFTYNSVNYIPGQIIFNPSQLKPYAYVLATNLNAILIININTDTIIGQIDNNTTVSGNPSNLLNLPRSITIDNDGKYLFVINQNNNNIIIIETDNNKIYDSNISNTGFVSPSSIYTNNNLLYITHSTSSNMGVYYVDTSDVNNILITFKYTFNTDSNPVFVNGYTNALNQTILYALTTSSKRINVFRVEGTPPNSLSYFTVTTISLGSYTPAQIVFNNYSKGYVTCDEGVLIIINLQTNTIINILSFDKVSILYGIANKLNKIYMTTLNNPYDNGSVFINYPQIIYHDALFDNINVLNISSPTNLLSPFTLCSTLNVSGSTILNNATTIRSSLFVSGTTLLQSSLFVSGTTLLNNATTIRSSLNVVGATSLASTLNVANATTLASTLTVGGATTLASTLNVGGATTLASTLNVGGATTLASTLNVGSNALINGNLQLGPGNGDYRQLRLGGGNSAGFLYGSFAKYGDGIHLGYNFFNNNNSTVNSIINTGGATTRISMGYGNISLHTGGNNSEPNNNAVAINISGNTGMNNPNPQNSIDIWSWQTNLSIITFSPITMTSNALNINSSTDLLNGFINTYATSKFNDTFDAFTAFNSSTTEGWMTAEFTYNTSGVYTGTRAINGISGEYIVLQVSNPMLINEYSYRTRDNETRGNPKKIYIYGSNDNQNWSLLNIQDGLATSQGRPVGPFAVSGVTTYYNNFAFLINSITSANSATFASVARITYNGYPRNNPKIQINNNIINIAPNTSSNVGIGNVSPAFKLDVTGETDSNKYATCALFNNNTARPALSTTSINGEIHAYGCGSGTTLNTSSDDGFLRLSAGGGTATNTRSYIDLSGFSNQVDMNRNIVFGTAGAERMRIDSSGNIGIGIGITNPTTILYVSGTSILLNASTIGSTLNIVGNLTAASTSILLGASSLRSTLHIANATTLLTTLNVGGASMLNSTITVGSGVYTTDTDLIHINGSRSWMFYHSGGNDASARIGFRPSSDSKTFQISTNDKTKNLVEFNATNSGSYTNFKDSIVSIGTTGSNNNNSLSVSGNTLINGTTTIVSSLNVSSSIMIQGKEIDPQYRHVVDLTAGAVDWFYPVALTGHIPTVGGFMSNRKYIFTVLKNQGGGGDSFNNHTLEGIVTSGGWSDLSFDYDIFHNFYQSNERSILGLYRGTQNYGGVVFYLRGGANAIYYISANCRNIVFNTTTAITVGDGTNPTFFSTFAIKNSSGGDVIGATTSNTLSFINLMTNAAGRYTSHGLTLNESLNVNNNNSTLYRFPPIAMNANTINVTDNFFSFYNGTYTVTTSSLASGYNSFALFNYTDTSEWRSVSGVYSPTTYEYTGSNTIGGISGEFIKISLPTRIRLRDYTFKTTGTAGNHPVKCQLLGSNNGSNYYLLNTAIMTPPAINTFYTAIGLSWDIDYYNEFAFVITSTDGNAGYVKLNEIIINGIPYSSSLSIVNTGDAIMSIRSGSENTNSCIYLGTPFDTNSGSKAAIIAQGISNYGRSKLHFCLENNSNNSGSATINDAKITIDSSGTVGIGTTTPNASAILDMTSTTKGFLPPRMTTTQINNISEPVNGLLIYNTDKKSPSVYTNQWDQMLVSKAYTATNPEFFKVSANSAPFDLINRTGSGVLLNATLHSGRNDNHDWTLTIDGVTRSGTGSGYETTSGGLDYITTFPPIRFNNSILLRKTNDLEFRCCGVAWIQWD